MLLRSIEQPTIARVLSVWLEFVVDFFSEDTWWFVLGYSTVRVRNLPARSVYTLPGDTSIGIVGAEN